ncbi:zinc finger protein 616-like [Tribolium madens]|uniref:zinc finger protein 616-like n=1 Tax=Tribolium madens TaxID=41895 RepID=UPI001CF72FC0|nr:zinc finger protein 616-like [Tribolium madens]
MSRVRCTICRQRLPTLKTLKSHYLCHSKIQIIKEIVKNSINNATPFHTRKKKRKIYDLYKTVYLHDKVQIKYNHDTIIIEDDSNTDNLIELTFDKDKKAKRKKVHESKRRPRKNKKLDKLLKIGIKKIVETPKSLHHQTGEFYECHCMEKPVTTTPETTPSSNKQIYCTFCGSAFQTIAELLNHESYHQYYCKLCNRIFYMSNHKEHISQHLPRIYVCYLCGFEFGCKEVLLGHLGYHFEQQTFENILNMEQDYNVYGFCSPNFTSGDYYSNISNILFFLTYPYDHNYSRGMFMKVVCDICYREFFIHDYERHMQTVHFLR